LKKCARVLNLDRSTLIIEEIHTHVWSKWGFPFKTVTEDSGYWLVWTVVDYIVMPIAMSCVWWSVVCGGPLYKRHFTFLDSLNNKCVGSILYIRYINCLTNLKRSSVFWKRTGGVVCLIDFMSLEGIPCCHMH
jgi:hypothetical protein